MTPAQARRDIRGFAMAGRVFIVPHAWERMIERGVTRADVHHALENAAACTSEPDDRWRVASADLDGDDLTLVVVIEDGDVVVTVF